MAFFASQLEHGWLPSHLDFFRRHLSHALPTRFFRLFVKFREDVLCAADISGNADYPTEELVEEKCGRSAYDSRAKEATVGILG